MIKLNCKETGEIKYLHMSVDEFNSSNWMVDNTDWEFVGLVEKEEDE